MNVRIDSFIKAISASLDSVEHEILGASTNHGKRIAVLCAEMGKTLGKSPAEIMGIAACALLHDNALTEYIFATKVGGHYDPIMKKHCELGQRNVDALCPKTNVKDFVLYHHERADGKGPFGIREGEGPLEAELITIADSIDVTYHLQQVEQDDLPAIRGDIAAEAGKRYSAASVRALLEVLDWPMILALKNDVIEKTAETAFIPWVVEIKTDTVFGLANFIAKIIDYKSVFTQKHSTQIANKAWFMGEYYNYDYEAKTELYLAAALHDIGKLDVPIAILEKPGKLTNEEFFIMKKHVSRTWEILKDIDGFQTLCGWASNHHEKLNGGGYPFGKKADDLDFNSRLIACIDVYQAVSEERPYHPARNHEETMGILRKMADADELDETITKDIDTALAPFDGKDLPRPKSAGKGCDPDPSRRPPQCFT
ncbi:MAG: HD domain-containing protein [Treponema sp.]|nr:HD domain-containing protein [Treponema sp.]